MLIDNTATSVMRLAVDRTRQGAVTGPELANAHRNVGRLLAADIANQLAIEECIIEHSTGPRQDGVRLLKTSQPIVVPLMRAGLFVAEGIWEMLPGAALMPWFPNTTAIPTLPGERPTILVDAVINSGRSMQLALDALKEKGSQNIIVATLVGYRPTLEAMAEGNPTVTFVAGRASDRSYCGRGGTDTGARLFGTMSWENENI